MSLVEERDRLGRMNTTLLHKTESSRDKSLGESSQDQSRGKSSREKSLSESSRDKIQDMNSRGMRLGMNKKETIADMKMTIGMMMVTRLWRTPGTGEETKGLWGPESEEECIRTMIADIG